VRLKVAWAVDELLLTAAERETWAALLNHQILIRRPALLEQLEGLSQLLVRLKESGLEGIFTI
jgi:hypothetical protein